MRDDRTGGRIKLAPMHKAWHDLMSKYDRLVIWSHVEAGKAVPLGTPIPSPSGWTTMGALQPGDLVFDSQGKPCRVRAVSAVQHERQLYEVEFDDGVVLRADADHNWIAWNIDDLHDGRAPRVVTTQQMLARLYRGERAMWKVPTAGAAEYPEAALPVHPYVFGAWLGDGNSNNAQMTGSVTDKALLDRCVALEGGCAFRADYRNKNVLYVTLGKGVRGKLRQLGVLGAKRIPTEYLTASIDQRRELLAGLLDTDGCVDGRDNKSVVEFTSCSEVLACGVLQLVRSLGFKARLAVGSATLKGRRTGDKYRVTFTARQPVFWLPRKLAAQKLDTEKRWTRHCTVVDIRPVPTEPVKCITVDSPDSSYLMGESYTVTHNTFQCSIARTLWEVGRDPSIRVLILSNTHGQAAKIGRAIAGYIENSDPLHEVWPDCVPTQRKTEPWQPLSGAITVKRPTLAKDPTISVAGVHGNVLGSRFDLIILDDVLDYENARTPEMRKELIDWLNSTITGRLTARAKMVVVGTAFHPEDALHHYAKSFSLNEQRAFKYPVLDGGAARWPEVWPIDRIERRRQELSASPSEFARQMLCEARDDADARFKREWIEVCIGRGQNKQMATALSSVPPGYKTITGVDLAVQQHSASDLTVLFTIIVHPDQTREVLEIQSGRWAGPDIVEKIADAHRRFLSLIVVENNAAQKYLEQYTRNAGIPVRGFTTGRNKAHPEYGVETIAGEMATGRWIIPSRGGLHPEARAWVDEMVYYDPASHTGDRLMASWFAREGIRMTAIKAQVARRNWMAR